MGRPKKGVAYELRIALEEVKPEVWRSVRVPDCTLAKLDPIILAAMGWDGGHLYSFEIGGAEYSDVQTARELEIEEARKATLSEVVEAGTAFRYKYDFGDEWMHTIRVERIIEQETKLLCLDGARVCPPEDVGGPWGYEDFLAAIRDPNHEQHEELMEWAPDFDPEAFSVEEANARLALVGRMMRP